MLKVATAKDMQNIDRITIKKYGIAGSVLMGNAGLAVADKINEFFFQNTEYSCQGSGISDQVKQLTTDNRQLSTVVILCGGGNNGGDGFVVARVLRKQGRNVMVFLSAKPKDLKGDAKIKYVEAVKSGVNIFPIKKFLTIPSSLISHPHLIVDAILGTGLNKDVRALLSDVIKKINKLKCPVVSIDISSGISSDTGQVMGCAVKADYTVTFGLPKRGHFLYPGAEHTGKLFVENIGFPQKLLNSKNIRVNLIQKEDAVSMIPQRPRYSHKGTYGHVLLIAGSRGKTGAAFMSAKSCLKAGAGLVTIGVPESLVNVFQSRITEEMVLPLPDKGDGTLSYKASESILRFLRQKANVLAIGPGLSISGDISKLVSLLIVESRVPMVIDADGINAIAGNANILRKSKSPVILTPHPGEMARLLQQGSGLPAGQAGVRGQGSVTEIGKDRIDTAVSFAKKTKTYLVLKGAPTVTAAPDGQAFINSTGNPGMATAGTGDVLTGMISAFLAQGLTPQNASVLGVYMHGFIGDIIAEKKGMHSLIASDIIDAIHEVFKMISR